MQNLDPKALTPTAKEAVLYANTPSYLLEKLRKDQGVRYLQAETDPHTLWEQLNQAKTVSNAEEVVWKYLLVVAIATSNWHERWAALSRTNLEDLEWGKVLWRLVQAEDVPTSNSTRMIDSKIDAPTFLWNRGTAH